jgi:hypothetical protein
LSSRPTLPTRERWIFANQSKADEIIPAEMRIENQAATIDASSAAIRQNISGHA